MSKIVAIDYGTKRIGIAISDSSRKIAFALETISNQKIFNFLDDLLKKEQVSTFVIGNPINLQNKQNIISILECRSLHRHIMSYYRQFCISATTDTLYGLW